MKERRKYERFALSLPTEVVVLTSGEQQVYELSTSDVSAGGAFFCVQQPVRQGTQVKLRMILASDRLKVLTGAQGLIKVAGTVVRCNKRGIAIAFDEKHQILPKNNG